MKINTQRRTKGFTLVEMIGVLAVIAILAAMLIPKIFSAINNSRVNSTVTAINTIKQAVADNYSKYGAWQNSAGTRITADTALFDNSLLAQGFIDKPFAVKLGNQVRGTTVSSIAATAGTMVQVRAVEDAVSSTTSASYNLAGGAVGSVTNTLMAQLVVECVITGLSAQECKDLKDIIDGPTLGTQTVGTGATVGRVKYPDLTAGAVGMALIYIAHR